MIGIFYNFNTQLTFSNGLTISFAIGEGNYCINRNIESNENPYNTYTKERTCKNCEVTVWDQDGKTMPIKLFLPEGLPNDGMVAGWVSSDDLAKIINNVSTYNI